MKFAVQHTLLPGETLVEKFKNAAAFGYGGVEVAAWGFPEPLPKYQAEIEAAVQASGLPVSSLCTGKPDDFVHPDPAERQQRLAGLVEMVKLAETVGAAGVVALPIRPPLHLVDLWPVADERTLITQLAVKMLQSALEQTAGLAAGIFLEPLNRYEAYYLRTIGQAAELCEAVGDGRCQIMADLFHMNIEEAQIPAAITAAAPHIGHVHLADSNRLLPGHGHTDFAGAFKALQAGGFSGWMALECGIPGEPFETLPAAAGFLKDQWQQAMA